MSAQSTSHDPHTDHRSITILVGIAVLTLICVAGANGAFTPTTEEPTKLYSVDGCDVYRFVDDSDTGHFVRCDNGKASTSVNGKHVLTELKPVTPIVKPVVSAGPAIVKGQHVFYPHKP